MASSIKSAVVLVGVPGLRKSDLAKSPRLSALAATGGVAELAPSFPCVTCCVQSNMTTGQHPSRHGVVSNGFYWRDRREIEMWTAWNDAVLQPQLWDMLRDRRGDLTSAVWFPMLSKGCSADYVCTPAPIHNPDGSESLWCYTKPTDLYGELRDALGHFPLQHFWGPLADIQSSRWIARSAVHAERAFQPDFFYIYLPHLDYAAQKFGPDSPEAEAAVGELDALIGELVDEMASARGDGVLWLIAGEYVITPVDHVLYPNRLLRDAGLLSVMPYEQGGEVIELDKSQAWALVDHQYSHIYLADPSPEAASRVADLFRGCEGVAEVLVGGDRDRYEMDHERSGEVIIISTPNSWQAYYYWVDDAGAPPFARTVDIHRKPGYDPVELHFDPVARAIPLDATLIRGSHGAPAHDAAQRTILLANRPDVLRSERLADTDVAGLVLHQFNS